MPMPDTCIVNGVTYPTYMDGKVWRFTPNKAIEALFGAGLLDVNAIIIAANQGKITVRHGMEIRMLIGMSVGGIADAYPYATIEGYEYEIDGDDQMDEDEKQELRDNLADFAATLDALNNTTSR